MRVLEGQNCPICGTSDLAEEWSGLVIILDAERSEIAKKLGVDIPDKFALKVR
jgi:DNA-directed RNA polymerase subunit E"